MKSESSSGRLTQRRITAMLPGESLSDQGPRGSGTLVARKLTNGQVQYYYRYTPPGGQRVRLPLGTSLSLADARRQFDEHVRRYQSGVRDLRTVLVAEEREANLQRERTAAAEADDVARRLATLGALLTAYVAQLRLLGKSSAHEVELTIQRHVAKPFPALWATPADEIRLPDLIQILAKVVDEGALRQADKLRSHIRAAYTAAIRAHQDPRGLTALRDLGITTNPALAIVTHQGSTNVRDRALSLAELQAYWRHIEGQDDAAGALLRFHLLTGAQRVEQLARLNTKKDVDFGGALIKILDTKGRRRLARLHEVPMIPHAVAALHAMNQGLGDFVFTVTGGFTAAAYHDVRACLVPIVKKMQEAGELEGGRPFTAGDLRRTVETRLAAAGVSREIRAQLQSHGLGGVQDRHYDRHTYMTEKREALEKLFGIVSGT